MKNQTIYYLVAYVLFTAFHFKIFDHFYDLFFYSYLPIKKKYKKFKFHLPMLGEIYRAKALLNGFFIHQQVVATDLPEYKYYTSLIIQLMHFHRTMGVGIKKVLPELRVNLIKDLQFEQRFFSEISASMAQFVIVTFVTWAFIFFSSSILDLPIKWSFAIFILVLQLSGAILFMVFLKSIKRKIFLPFYFAISELYIFSMLYEIGVPLNDALDKSKLLTGSLVKTPKLSGFADRILKLIDRLRQSGVTLGIELGEIKDEIWHFQEQEFIKFTKILQVAKFFTLSFFYLPAYFIYLASIFKFFMEQ
jgi:hypothetical protein